MKTATVVKNAGSHYLLSELPAWNVFPAVLRGVLRLGAGKTTNPVAVGDIVSYEEGQDGMAVITSVLPRRNYVIRRSTNLCRQAHIIAANVDMNLLNGWGSVLHAKNGIHLLRNRLHGNHLPVCIPPGQRISHRYLCLLFPQRQKTGCQVACRN